MKSFTPLAVLLLVLLAISCTPPEPINQENSFPPGSVSVAWRTSLGDQIRTSAALVLDGDNLYQLLTSEKLARVSAATGQIVWTKEFPVAPGTTPVRIGDYYYVLEHPVNWVFDPPKDRNPYLMRTGVGIDDPVEAIDLGPDPNGSNLNGSMYDEHFQQHNGVLYWGSMNNGDRRGLLSLDPANIVDTGSGLNCVPTLVFATQYNIISPIVFAGNVALFEGAIEHGVDAKAEHNTLFGVDLASGLEVWSKNPSAFSADGGSLVVLDGDLLQHTYLGTSRFNTQSGKVIWSNPDLRVQSPGGILVDGDRAFGTYSGSPGALADNKAKAVNSWKLSTGELLWQDQYTAHEIGATPQLYGNKLFQVTAGNLLVYNADTGERLYEDNTVKGDGYVFNNTVRYGDLMIFANGIEIIAVDLSKS